MQAKSDAQLLRDHVERGADTAFRELVTRHTSFVYSAALRQVESSALAADIAQSVFVDLARKAGSVSQSLLPEASLAGWLHRSTRYAALNHLRDTRRRQNHERQAMEQLLTNAEPAADWEQIRPALDEALDRLSDEDREALLLRYFKNQDYRAVGLALGVSDDTAQKRVSRAVERLREILAQHGVTAGAGALALVISANAVQAAPVGLVVTISTAAALAGTAVTASTLIAATTKTIAMTTLQKIAVTAALTAAVGTGIYEVRQAVQLRDQVQVLQQQQAPLVEQIHQLQTERDKVNNQVAGLNEELASAKKNNLELMKLRGEIGVFRAQDANMAARKAKLEQPALLSAIEYLERARKHERNREFEAAFDDINKAIEMDAKNTSAYNLRVILYLNYLPSEYGGAEKALADYTRILELEPTDFSARQGRGVLYSSLKQYDKAIVEFTTMIEGGPNNKLVAVAYFERGRVYGLHKLDYSKAISDFTAALKFDPQIRENVHRYRGECYERLGEFDKAQQDFMEDSKNKLRG